MSDDGLIDVSDDGQIRCTGSSFDMRFYGNDSRTAVTIGPDGRVTLAEGTTIDEASRTFWEVFENCNPLRPTVERLQAALRAAMLPHRCWEGYQPHCPLWPPRPGVTEEGEKKCTCGAAEHNRRIEEALRP